MPIYEYFCSKCGIRFEELVRGEQTPECPNCGTTEVTKQLSTPAIAVKGQLAGDVPPCRSSGCCSGNCQFGDWNS